MNQDEFDYQNALDYLYRFVDYSLTRNFRYSPEKFDLGRMRQLLEYLGNPHQQYRIIHVAGTKGKGSVAAILANIYKTAGYRTGFYTSPHLQDFSERIQVNGERISHKMITTLVDELKPWVEKVERITTFELTTALGFMYFARQKVDVAVVEVGLGGRLDATNVVDPLVSVITSISYDHTAVLGNTLEMIAGEKAGIIKPHTPVVVSPQNREAFEAIAQVAEEREAPLTLVGREVVFKPMAHSMDGQTFQVWSQIEPDSRPVQVSIPLLGLHQVENATTAYAAMEIARQRGLAVSDKDALDGFRSVFWPGRFEVLQRFPPIIIDSAHNRDSARRLSQAIKDYIPDYPVVLVFGASEDKDIDGMFAELLPSVQSVIFTESIHPRAMNAQKLVELAQGYGTPVEAVLPVEAAVAKALEFSSNQKAVVVAGSLFIAAAVREVLQQVGLPVAQFEISEDVQ
ncbi:MAG: folylpolyglutamate synthase/dihydrofolate synthase family protein [Anaerolineaceae bacterium]|nr:folylpolyglutamate synthase/dihydrofolate synthase family protein [Anaerolineaceae bacterium]